MMRLRTQYPRLHDPRGWDCRVVGGRLDKIVDPVCSQCLYDLTRYRWLKHKYDEIEPAWKGYNAYDSTLPDKLPNGNDLPGAGLRQSPGFSWKLAVINACLCSDSNGRKRRPTWGRWPRELDYMLKQRGWTEGVDFVDWKKAEAMPATHPKQSEETPRDLGAVNRFLCRLYRFFTKSNTEETRDTEGPDAEDLGTLALLIDWNPSQRALDNGLRLCDMEGMGPYPDWDELLEEPAWRAQGISKIPRDRWGQAFGRKVQDHVLGEWVEGHGHVILQTDKFSFCSRRRLRQPMQGPREASRSRCSFWQSVTTRFVCIHIPFGIGLALALFSVLYVMFCHGRESHGDL